MTKGAIPSTLEGLLREEQELEKLEAEILARRAKVKAAQQILNGLTPTHVLAIQLHEKLCRWNHTDQCGWMYFVNDGVHDWGEHSHQEYLRRAQMIMSRLAREPITCDNVTEFVKRL